MSAATFQVVTCNLEVDLEYIRPLLTKLVEQSGGVEAKRFGANCEAWYYGRKGEGRVRYGCRGCPMVLEL